jgi:hypothetical protein
MSVKEDWPRPYDGRKYRNHYGKIKWDTVPVPCPQCRFVNSLRKSAVVPDARCNACGSLLSE